MEFKILLDQEETAEEELQNEEYLVGDEYDELIERELLENE